MAVSVGHLLYAVQWEISTTKISLMLSGDNYKIKLVLSYTSEELEEWVKQIKKRKLQKISKK